MDLSTLKGPKGARRPRKRLGRGESSGWGKTAGRGHKGQKARSGKKLSADFEGGQMPLFRRLPKFGFINPFKKQVEIIHLRDLDRFEEGSVVDLETLKKAGLVRKKYDGLFKILGKGELKKPLTVKASAFSEGATKAIVAAGGKAEVVG